MLSRFRRRREPGTINHRFGDFFVPLPANHALLKYQAEHRLYDQFPFVLGQSRYDGWIVDIGANVGYTLASLASFNAKRVICIEPSNEWFGTLQKTAENVRSGGSTVVCVQAAVGPDGIRGNLESINDSTASFIAADAGDLVLRSLDNIVRPVIADAEVSLIKCDVDGFDATALDSGEALIGEHSPLLYVEAEVRNLPQLQAWEKTLRWLAQTGYDRFATIDNFGLPLLRKAGAEQVIDCLRYTLDLNVKRSTRTIWYFDIFAPAPKRREQFDAIMFEYDTRFVRSA